MSFSFNLDNLINSNHICDRVISYFISILQEKRSNSQVFQKQLSKGLGKGINFALQKNDNYALLPMVDAECILTFL